MESSTLTAYLQRSLDIAALSIGDIRTGPLLGWVVVKDGIIVEEGTAKDNFLSTPDNSSTRCSWQHSLLFLSINPLADSHALASFCTARGIRAYYVATDSTSLVRQDALSLNCRYLTWQHKRRPYIILKWAETADGFIARADYQPYWISNAHARKVVHQWRSEEAAIWVGKNTYRHDNPRLNVRDWEGRDPVRILIDPELQLSEQLRVFDRSQPTICYNDTKSETHQNLDFVRLPDNATTWEDRVNAVFEDLYRRRIQSLFVEGGRVLLSFLLKNGWWDEARVFRAPITFERGTRAPEIDQTHYFAEQRVSDNTLTIYRRSAKS